MLYGRRFQTPVCWEEVGSKELASTDVVLATTEKIETIHERLKSAQDSFTVEMCALVQEKGKLSPRFKGPFKILKRVEEVAFVLELPKEMRGRKSRQLRNKVIPLVKVQWKHRKGISVRWEQEEKMMIRYPHLFQE
ncbi:hypothetical protein Tco_1240901 [Tanacetum coccineum]